MKSYRSPLHPRRFDDWASIKRGVIALRGWSEFVWENMSWVVAVKISGGMIVFRAVKGDQISHPRHKLLNKGERGNLIVLVEGEGEYGTKHSLSVTAKLLDNAREFDISCTILFSRNMFRLGSRLNSRPHFEGNYIQSKE